MAALSGGSLCVYLSYRDPRAALEWFAALGFDTVARQDDEHGSVVHAEVRLGEAVVMIAGADAAYDVPELKGASTGSGVYLWFPEPEAVDGWYDAAVGAGAQPVLPPEDTAWHSRRARVLDREGHEWSAGTYRPGGAG
ncbi:VOC family protein [Streptomyces sp. NPDC051921]|uniref:VOC family protein n=1 Tax=Streptomyces sp. NPDC051921 TaxID=3155806 RepID=UPI003428B368